MKKLRHPNVLHMMGIVMSPENLCIVTEFLSSGSLFQLLCENRSSLDWRRRTQIALDIAKGMNYLHCCKPPIIHGDLSSANILVNKNWTVKVADFGHARPKSEEYLTDSLKGTGLRMAPNAVCCNPEEKLDVYSYGKVLTELVPTSQVIGAPSDLGVWWRSIIDRCLHRDPQSRPSFKEVIGIFKSRKSGASPSLQN